MKLTKDTTLERVLKIKGSEKILAKHNFPCITCPMAKTEMASLKLGDVCSMYGVDLEKLLKELNSNPKI